MLIRAEVAQEFGRHLAAPRHQARQRGFPPALGVALAGDASVKIVMMDEVLISQDNKRKIADRMLALAKQGVIDAFVIVDVTEAGWPTWCDVIRTGEEVPA